MMRGMEKKRISICPAALSESMDADLRQIEATMSEACARLREREAARLERRARRIAEQRPLQGLLVRRAGR